MLLLVVTFSCSEDFETTENSNGTHFGIKEKGTKVRIITNDEVNFIKSKLEQEIEKSGKISILENKGSSFRTANTGEIDYSQIIVGFPKNRTVFNSNLVTLNLNCHHENKQI